MEKRKLSLWVPILVIAAALLMLAVSSGTVDAAPRAGRGGGKGHGSGGTTTGNGICAAAPNPVNLWSDVTISGSGFTANSSVGFVLTDAGGTHVGWVMTDAAGSFRMTYQTFVLGTTTATFSGYASCSFLVV